MSAQEHIIMALPLFNNGLSKKNNATKRGYFFTLFINHLPCIELFFIFLQILVTIEYINMIEVNQSAIASICSLVEQKTHMLFVKDLYRQYCITQNIPIQLSDIEIRLRMLQLTLPNFNRLKMIVNGY